MSYDKDNLLCSSSALLSHSEREKIHSACSPCLALQALLVVGLGLPSALMEHASHNFNALPCFPGVIQGHGALHLLFVDILVDLYLSLMQQL